MSVDSSKPIGPIRRLWRDVVVESIEIGERESRQALASDSSAIDRKTMVVCVVVALSLTLLQYYGLSDRAAWMPNLIEWIGLDGAAESLRDLLWRGPSSRLFSLFYWVASCVVLYFVIPAAVVIFVFRQPLSEYGLQLKGAFGHFKIYLLLLMIVLPAVIGVSFSERFQQQYPFYRSYSDNEIPAGFIYWEFAYAAQFFALEFFFRGFMVHGLKRRFGFYSVFAMMIPYCMIHFGKPFPETIGAILAGFALGLLSLRTGTIWLGFMIHVSVAWSMDLAALAQRGLIP